MLVKCTGCGTTYKIADEKVPPSGVKVKCPKCRVIFHVGKVAEGAPETLGEKLFGKDVARRPWADQGGPNDRVEAEREQAPAQHVEREQATDRQAEREHVAGQQAEPEQAPGREVEQEQAQGREAIAAKPAAPSESVPEAQENVSEEVRAPVEEAVCESAREAVSESEKQIVRETVREMVRETVREPVRSEVRSIGNNVEPEAPAPLFQSGEEDPRNLARALVSDVLFYNRDKREKGLRDGKVLAYLGKEIARSWELYKERVGIEKALGTDYFREAVNEILGEEKEIL